METKQVYVVQGIEFSSKEEAEQYETIYNAGVAYRKAAKDYQEALRSCECVNLTYIDTQSRPWGATYQNEFEDYLQKDIDVAFYRCPCCGKSWMKGAFDGKEEHYQHSGDKMVQVGTY